MLTYILIIVISAIIIILANTFCVPFEWLNLMWNSINTVISVIAVIAVDGIGATIVRRALPEKWFMPHKRIFQVSKKEHNFYKAIKIKSWKDKVPELGGFTSFHKNELKSTSDKGYLERFIIEVNYGVICHLENALFGFVIFLIPMLPINGTYIFTEMSIWIPVCAVNFVLSMLPVFILRHTNHTLVKLYNKQLKKEEKEKLKQECEPQKEEAPLA